MRDWEMALEEPPASGNGREHKCRICGEPSTCQTWRVARRLYWCADCYEKHAEERQAYSAQEYSTQKGSWDWWDWKRGRKVRVRRQSDKHAMSSISMGLPFTVEDECPDCQRVQSVDLTSAAFAHLSVNGTVTVGFDCDGGDTKHEPSIWNRTFVLRVHLAQVQQKEE